MLSTGIFLFWLSILVMFGGCASRSETALREDLYNEMQSLKLDDFAEKDEAAQALPETPNLSDYLEYAAINNPALKAAYYRWTAAVEKAPQARALPNPTVSYTHYIREVETRVGAQKNRFAIMQMVPWPTKLTTKSDIAVRNAIIKKHEYNAEKLALFFRVRKAYYEYYYLGQSTAILKDNLLLLGNIEEAMQARYKASEASNPSLIQLQVELGRMEDRLKSLEALRPAVAAQLNAAIGRDPNLDLPQPGSPSFDMPAIDEKELLSILKSDNPALQAAREKIQAAQAGKRLAQTEYLPDFSLGGSFIETEKRTDMKMKDNGKDPVMLTLEMSVPIWINKYSASVREAEANRKEAASMLEEKSNTLSADMRMVFFRFGDAERKYNLFAKTLIPKAEQSLDAMQISFSVSRSEFSSLLDAERTLLELRLMAERAHIDKAIYFSELEMLAGRDLRTPTR
ncbi:MAG: TolC family protein [Planctomycetes bacterium]|nr:TolC family protein [Planctomycetota bacterium]